MTETSKDLSVFERTCHIVIIGGGLSGLAAAIGFRSAGHTVTVLERMTEFGKLGAGINIPPNASKALQCLNITETLDCHMTKPEDVVLRSYRDGAILSDLKLIPDIQSTYGASYTTIHRSTFHTILLEKATREGVVFKFGVTILNVDFSEPAVFLSNGEICRGDFILGADGEHSQCRELLLGKLDPSSHAGDFIFAFDIKQNDIRGLEDVRALADPPNLNMWFGPDAHVVVFALQGDDQLHVIGSRRDPVTNKVQARPQQTDLNEMRRFFKNWDPRLRKLLLMAQFCVRWTLTVTPELDVWSHHDGKFALLGDAAHAMTPYLAQGAAQGIEDAVVLAVLSAQLSSKDQIPDLIAIYEGLRKPRALEIKRRSYGMRETNSMGDGPMQEERDRLLTQHKPFEGYPLPWADPVFQKWLYSYDACGEAERAWKMYLNGEWPGR